MGETLYSLHLNGLVYAHSELTAPWGIEMPHMVGKMMFHIVTRGDCWLRLPGNDLLCLKPGELELGYQPEAAFSRAYKRVIGVPPLRQKQG
ncbi:MAG: cupin domain-containing protein [Cellvibrionaceae bacterium]|nr:cupin domain-containing protein [Cellvibrionaceae bacterium]